MEISDFLSLFGLSCVEITLHKNRLIFVTPLPNTIQFNSITLQGMFVRTSITHFLSWMSRR